MKMLVKFKEKHEYTGHNYHKFREIYIKKCIKVSGAFT